MTSSASTLASDTTPWWRLLNRYQWFVLVVSALGWMFDCLDQQLFTLSRSITMRDLMSHADTLKQTAFGGYATSIFMVGWASGGLIFGMMGDRWGRAKTMAVTILIYATCTGLSGLAQSWGYFAFFRFLTGAGVGGEFAVGAALVAEAMPDRARPHALGMLQALSAIGNIAAAVLLGVVVPSAQLGWGWRGLYYIGSLPALVAVFVFWRLREPEKWITAKAEARRSQATRKLGRIAELFNHPQWRRNTLVGVSLAVAGVLGLWGVGFYSPELIDSAIPTIELKTRAKVDAVLKASSPQMHLSAVTALDEKEQQKYFDLFSRTLDAGKKTTLTETLSTPLTSGQKSKMGDLLENALTDDEKTKLKSRGAILQQIAAFFGITCFTALSARVGRRRSFFVALVLAWASIIVTFTTFHEPKQIYYLWPILGFGALAPFGGYAIYFPELFPTRLRTTGTSFCYNVGRYIAALGPLILGPLARSLDGWMGLPGFRSAAVVLASSYLIGLVALLWAPETVNQPLPEDEKSFTR